LVVGLWINCKAKLNELSQPQGPQPIKHSQGEPLVTLHRIYSSTDTPTGYEKMKEAICTSWKVVMDNRHNPLRHLDLASQHYLMQVLGWMWSMIFSLSFLSIFHFGYVWMAHLLCFGGAAMTVAVFRDAEKIIEVNQEPAKALSAASKCVWQLDCEA
jgi:hypothetical protein